MSSRPRTQADLAIYRERLSRCVQDAIAEFIRRFGDELYRWRPTSQANVVRDYIVDNVKREFPDGVDGIRHHQRRGLFLLYIRDEYVLRFKKLGRGRRTMNIPTQLALDFLAQQPLQLFPGLAPALHLNVGYEPKVTLAASTVWITCPDRHGVEWEWQISDEADVAELPISTSPARPLPAPMRKPLARPRGLPATGEMTDGPED